MQRAAQSISNSHSFWQVRQNMLSHVHHHYQIKPEYVAIRHVMLAASNFKLNRCIGTHDAAAQPTGVRLSLLQVLSPQRRPLLGIQRTPQCWSGMTWKYSLLTGRLMAHQASGCTGAVADIVCLTYYAANACLHHNNCWQVLPPSAPVQPSSHEQTKVPKCCCRAKRIHIVQSCTVDVHSTAPHRSIIKIQQHNSLPNWLATNIQKNGCQWLTHMQGRPMSASQLFVRERSITAGRLAGHSWHSSPAQLYQTAPGWPACHSVWGSLG
jgi:hypothetical protein